MADNSMLPNLTMSPTGRRHRYLIPEFPQHLTFSFAPDLRTSTRKRPNHKSLHAAALAGDVIDVLLFIREGVDVNEVDSVGDAPIHFACISKHRNQDIIVKILLVNGADPSVLTITGQTVLHLLVLDSKSPSTLLTMKLLVESGVDINIEDAIKRTPLTYLLNKFRSFTSSRRNIRSFLSEEIVKFLLLNGARCPKGLRRILMPFHLHIFRYILQNPTLIDSDLSETTFGRFICDSTTIPLALNFVSGTKMFYSDKLVSWGDDCSISKWSYLTMSETNIAELAKRVPLLYFTIRQPSRVYKKHSELKWEILKIHKSQFDKFCFYFVKEQLKIINFTNGAVTLNYDCVRTLALFLNLEDLVNLCVAFNFADRSPENMRKRYFQNVASNKPKHTTVPITQ